MSLKRIFGRVPQKGWWVCSECGVHDGYVQNPETGETVYCADSEADAKQYMGRERAINGARLVIATVDIMNDGRCLCKRCQGLPL